MAAASSLNHFPPIREIGKSALVGNRRPFFHEGGPPSRSVGRSGFFSPTREGPTALLGPFRGRLAPFCELCR
jgi:hypothetical protein